MRASELKPGKDGKLPEGKETVESTRREGQPGPQQAFGLPSWTLQSDGKPPSQGVFAQLQGHSGPASAPAQQYLLALQRRYGNRYVQGLLSRSTEAPQNNGVPEEVEGAIESSRGAGAALDGTTRLQMESAFSTDFGNVRIHTDARADGLNQALSARAFATGRDVYFRDGEYRPGTSSGRELLAHELTHVVQQGGAQRLAPASHSTIDGAAGAGSFLGPQIGRRTASESSVPGEMSAKGGLPAAKPPQGAPPPSAVRQTAPVRAPSAAPNTVTPEAPRGTPMDSGALARPMESPGTAGEPGVIVEADLGAGSEPSDPQSKSPDSSPITEAPLTEAPQKEPVPAAAGQPAVGGKSRAQESKAPSAPNPRQAIAPVTGAVRQRATKARRHSDPGVPVASAQGAAKIPATEQTRAAAKQTVATLNGAKTGAVRPDEFKRKLKEAIEKATPKPKTEAQAHQVVESGATGARGVMQGHLTEQRDEASGQLATASQPDAEVKPSDVPAEAQTNLKPEPVGAPPAPVSAAPVVPEPLPPERLDYSSDREPTDRAMAENHIEEEQLAEGNEPSFGSTLQARSEAVQHEATVESRYRQSETTVRAQGQNKAQATLGKDLGGLHDARQQKITKVVGQQVGTKDKDSAERERITAKINEIKNGTRKDVSGILSSMESGAGALFDMGLRAAEAAYAATFEREKGGTWTWLTTWGSDWEELIENSLSTARDEYLRQIDSTVDKVAEFVNGMLDAAKKRVAQGLHEVETFVKGLDQSVQKFGAEALKEVAVDFEGMVTEIDQRRDSLIDKLADQYKASYERMSAMEEKLREENKSLWQRVYDATIGLIKKILAFKDMLLGILGKAASFILDIIAHPIRFLENLVSSVKQGISNFVQKIGTYLQKGLMEWLFGALAGAGLQLPEKFDLQGIVSLVLQILGLTYASFRRRAVALVGEPVVAALEKAADVFKVFLTEGIPGLWRFIKEKISDLKSMVLDAIFDFIKERVIVAGITWIIGLLNPASAFFKACKGIYDIVVFFIERGSQIMSLVNAIIDSIAAIAQGALGNAIQWVENALAKSIPVAIGFLASLLGLGDPAAPVRETIEKAKAPIDAAIDWVINLAVKGIKAAGKFVGGLFGGKDKEGKAGEQPGGGHGPRQEGDGEVGKTVAFTAAGENHRLWINVQGRSVRIMMASLDPDEVSVKLEGFKDRLGQLPEERRKIAEKLLGDARSARGVTQRDAELAAQKKEVAEKEQAAPNAAQEFSHADDEAEAAEQSLGEILGQLYEIFGPQEGNAVVTIEELFTITPSEVGGQPGNYGDELRRKIQSYERRLLSERSEVREGAVREIRGEDKKWFVAQGVIYAPFVSEQQAALAVLQAGAAGAEYLISLERGGSLLGAEIAGGSRIVHIAVPKPPEEVKGYKSVQQSNLEATVRELMSGREDEPMTIALAETVVGGGSVNALIGTINRIIRSNAYPNLKFKLLALQQTIHTKGEGHGVIFRGLLRSGSATIVTAATRYILGEDVDYQVARNSSTSRSPVIVFNGGENTLKAYRISPAEGFTARDILIDLVNGKFNGKLPGVL